jgi:hypothetical protein
VRVLPQAKSLRWGRWWVLETHPTEQVLKVHLLLSLILLQLIKTLGRLLLPFNLVKGVAYLLLSSLEGHETVVDVLVETGLIIAHQRWWMMMMVMQRLMMMLRRLMMMFQRRLVVVLRSMVRERSMEAIMDAPCGERHAPSLYTAHGLLIILWMIMIKITWPPTCTYRCL